MADKKSRRKSKPTNPFEAEISALLSKCKRDYERGKITEERFKEIVEELNKPVLSNSEADKFVNNCRLWVDEYKRLECRVSRKTFDDTLKTIESFASKISPLMVDVHDILVEVVDDIVTITQAFILKEEGRLVGCTPTGLLDAVEKLGKKVIRAEKTSHGGLRSAPGRCLICMEEFREGAVVRSTDCWQICHSRCILPWLAENTYCPNFCGSELRGLAHPETTQQITETETKDDQ